MRWIRRLKALLRRSRLETELGEELAFHLEMRERLYSTPVLFTRDPEHPRVRAFVEDGGRAALLLEGSVVVLDGSRRIDLGSIEEMPLAEGTDADLDVILGASAALYAFGVSVDRIAESLRSFAG